MSEQREPDATLLATRLQEAAALADDERPDEAYALLVEEVADHAEDATLLCMLGVLAQRLDEDAAAFEYFRRCLSAQPSDPAILVAAGAGLAALDDPDAEAALRLAALSAPTMPLARLRYGAFLAREGVLDLAITELTAARELDESVQETHTALAGALLLSGRVDEAIDSYVTALSLDDDDAWTRAIYALALHGAGRADEAAEEFYRVGRERPEDGELQLAVALACAAQEWSDEAWAALARAEGAPDAPPGGLLLEVEDAIESGADASAALLAEEIAPPMLRERLLLGQ